MTLTREETAVLLNVAGEALRSANVHHVYVLELADGQPWFQVLRLPETVAEGATLAVALERLRETDDGP